MKLLRPPSQQQQQRRSSIINLLTRLSGQVDVAISDYIPNTSSTIPVPAPTQSQSAAAVTHKSFLDKPKKPKKQHESTNMMSI